MKRLEVGSKIVTVTPKYSYFSIIYRISKTMVIGEKIKIESVEEFASIKPQKKGVGR